MRFWTRLQQLAPLDPATLGQDFMLPITSDLAARLRRAARARGQPPEALAEQLLKHGLQRAARRALVSEILQRLTPRQREVAWLTTRGYTNQRIAEELVISPETVKTHIRHVLEAFNLSSKTDLRVLLLDLGVRGWEVPSDD